MESWLICRTYKQPRDTRGTRVPTAQRKVDLYSINHIEYVQSLLAGNCMEVQTGKRRVFP